jgi:NAD-dependent dihydropyrimidine dehydrogenase PreA subunit
MTYVIAQPCTDVMDKSCIQECPVDCIYEGGRALYINPDECIDCGSCEPACPEDAVYFDADLPDEYRPALESNAAFFLVTLEGRSEPLGNPGGFSLVGPVAADTAFVAALPPKALAARR